MNLCSRAKKNGLKTFLNINGGNSKLASNLIEKNLLNYIALDIKASLIQASYQRVSSLNRGVELMISNFIKILETCINGNTHLAVRKTIIPPLDYNKLSICEIVRLMKHCIIYVLQESFPFREVLKNN